MFLTGGRIGYKRSLTPIICFGNTVKISTWFLIGCTVATLVTGQKSFYTNGRYGKRNEPVERAAASAFWSGSRYGRSGNSALSVPSINGVEEKSNRVIGNDDLGKEVEISPRIDRFFLGSRYGKRTVSKDRRIDSLKHFETSLDFLISFDHMRTDDDNEHMNILSEELKDKNHLVDLISQVDSSVPMIIKNGPSSSSPGNGFTCLYTGMTNLYRCFRRRINATQ